MSNKVKHILISTMLFAIAMPTYSKDGRELDLFVCDSVATATNCKGGCTQKKGWQVILRYRTDQDEVLMLTSKNGERNIPIKFDSCSFFSEESFVCGKGYETHTIGNKVVTSFTQQFLENGVFTQVHQSWMGGNSSYYYCAK